MTSYAVAQSLRIDRKKGPPPVLLLQKRWSLWTGFTDGEFRFVG